MNADDMPNENELEKALLAVALVARAYPSDDYPGLASLATGSTRASHVQLVLEASKALNEIAGLREDLARLHVRHDGLIQRLSG